MKAAIYARVSSDIQRKEGTIDSQIAELKKQVANAGDTLAKEYVDDGFSGTLLDRPAMNQLREDLKTNVFEAVYFLNTDRIARDTIYQQIIIGEFLRYKKHIIINGKDYIHNPENKFKMTVLGAVAELERAKIVERSMRGRKYWLKQGILMSNGSGIFGYHYHKRTPSSAPFYTVAKQEAVAVKEIFEAYAKGQTSINQITRILKKKSTYRRPKTGYWNPHHVRSILHNEMYIGIRYFDTMTDSYETDDPMHKSKTRKMVWRDRRDWIGIKVPAIISKELFEKVKTRLQHNKSCLRNAKGKQLLSGLLWCGKCDARCFSYRQYLWKRRLKEKLRIYEKIFYTCMGRKMIGYCNTTQTDVRPIDSCVFDMIKETLTDPAKLKACMSALKRGGRANKEKIEKQVKDLEKKTQEAQNKKKRIIDLYAAGDLEREEYQRRIATYDSEVETLKTKQNELTERVPVVHKPETINTAIKNYTEQIKIRLEQCIDFESRRRFLLDFIEKATYRDDRVTAQGSVPVEESKIEFLIKRVIDRLQLREQMLKYDRSIGLRGTLVTRPNFGFMAKGEARVVTPTKLLDYALINQAV